MADLLTELDEQHRHGPDTYIGQLCKNAADQIRSLRKGKAKVHRKLKAAEIAASNYATFAHEWRQRAEGAEAKLKDTP